MQSPLPASPARKTHASWQRLRSFFSQPDVIALIRSLWTREYASDPGSDVYAYFARYSSLRLGLLNAMVERGLIPETSNPDLQVLLAERMINDEQPPPPETSAVDVLISLPSNPFLFHLNQLPERAASMSSSLYRVLLIDCQSCNVPQMTNRITSVLPFLSRKRNYFVLFLGSIVESELSSPSPISDTTLSVISPTDLHLLTLPSSASPQTSSLAASHDLFPPIYRRPSLDSLLSACRTRSRSVSTSASLSFISPSAWTCLQDDARSLSSSAASSTDATHNDVIRRGGYDLHSYHALRNIFQFSQESTYSLVGCNWLALLLPTACNLTPDLMTEFGTFICHLSSALLQIDIAIEISSHHMQRVHSSEPIRHFATSLALRDRAVDIAALASYHTPLPQVSSSAISPQSVLLLLSARRFLLWELTNSWKLGTLRRLSSTLSICGIAEISDQASSVLKGKELVYTARVPIKLDVCCACGERSVVGSAHNCAGEPHQVTSIPRKTVYLTLDADPTFDMLQAVPAYTQAQLLKSPHYDAVPAPSPAPSALSVTPGPISTTPTSAPACDLCPITEIRTLSFPDVKFVRFKKSYILGFPHGFEVLTASHGLPEHPGDWDHNGDINQIGEAYTAYLFFAIKRGTHRPITGLHVHQLNASQQPSWGRSAEIVQVHRWESEGTMISGGNSNMQPDLSESKGVRVFVEVKREPHRAAVIDLCLLRNDAHFVVRPGEMWIEAGELKPSYPKRSLTLYYRVMTSPT